MMMVGNLTNLGLVGTTAKASVLIVGDGNFSYTCAFVRHIVAQDDTVLERIRIVATSLDTYDELVSMYPGAAVHVQELEAHNVRVLHGINATKLEMHKDALQVERFDRIVFNFPHYAEGGNKRNKINKHRQLISQFFQSATSVLAHDGQVWVTLCAGQGGTPEETIVRPVGDTWQVAQCAASAGLILMHVHAAPTDALSKLGYNSVGHRLQEKAFRTQESLTHVFCLEALGLEAYHALSWSRDISFWFDDQFTEDKLMDVLESVYGPKVTIKFDKIDEYTSDDGRHARGYRLELSSKTMALAKEYVNAKTDEVVDVLDNHAW
ncbi:unnamed protein product [Aphanomyces euteiches]|uniref:FDX-ACB domain-containing protein n=1 Tax=Aphanomyces euteiches TaxID=100861 RepID=A0A6G0XAB0_9STRA|nr:hypothetical protein Ae201684_007045 [Aphanomyces euteiches]KAF0736894.1 hypothetical protein Ae201684_007048 [Aphanomyces euteiches]KAH9086994.1 hypothetical protein Ae201684P_000409 [Aphanomyces euteiches]KAH9087440.1 hypothetical protein Ae201684P_000848 [Aphanomyces euteiches]KAH9133432.1 hypothetical protein AeRB84_020567 [Aphanomyces euteiches]